ncbi:AEC family transporter [Amycolatopsis sp. K13G38]|uniref:AEC family transporter n=1 Tax=Amycolatopsis acididurans TaxID=2724524 RepID=A0ABX1IYI3_9PSEU|nr:AEC family transporter [Amycolatopsis acididurans]NKQ52568.1 AEC family transporter [Amycolatopsis acididurans]
MSGVLPAFVPIWSLTGLGYLLSRFRLLGPGADQVLTKLTFNVAMPAVLFSTLLNTPFSALLNKGVISFAAGTLAAAVAGFTISRFVFRRKLSEWAVSGMASCYANAGNLGIPVAVQVLGDSTFIVVVLLAQTLFMMPSMLALLETDARAPDTARWKTLALLPVRTPVIAASMLGVLAGTTGLRPPALVMQPVHLLAGAGVGVALLALGMSLNPSTPMAPGGAGRRWELASVVGLKLFAQPAITLAAGLLLGLPRPLLLATVVAAALPIAQNVFIATSQYELDSRFVRDCVLVSTLVAMVSLSLIVWVVGLL